MTKTGRRKRVVAPDPSKNLPSKQLAGIGHPVNLEFFARFIGGKQALIDWARWSSEEKMKAICRAWDGMTTKDKNRTSLEEILDGVGMKPRDFISEITGVAIDLQADMTQWITAMDLPEVVKKTAEMAMRPEGHRDRKMFLQGAGFLPRPNNQFAMVANIGAQPQPPEQPQRVDPESSGNALPSIEEENVIDAQFEDV